MKSKKLNKENDERDTTFNLNLNRSESVEHASYNHANDNANGNANGGDLQSKYHKDIPNKEKIPSGNGSKAE